jgi:hypothetical protein
MSVFDIERAVKKPFYAASEKFLNAEKLQGFLLL